jgi:ubiquinone/menaquinone biosynthesis C-methylase UbiE
LQNLNAESVLDLGCGHGYLLPELSRRFNRVTGVEPSSRMRERAQEFLNREKDSKHGSIEILEGNGSGIPLSALSIDLVISLLSFRYMDWGASLKEVHRVLKQGGTFLIVDLFVQDNVLWNLPAIIWDGIKVVLGQRKNQLFRQKLNALSKAVEWKKMVMQNPKRFETGLPLLIQDSFLIEERKVLGQSLRGKIIAYRLRKKPSD